MRISGFNWACVCRYEVERGMLDMMGNPTIGLDFQNYNKVFGVNFNPIDKIVGFNYKFRLFKK